MPWVKRVLSRKGMCIEALDRVTNLYSNSVSIVVVNNITGRAMYNIRQSISQGDKVSMEWFTYGIDPVINYLEKRLRGILIHSLPVHGPLPSPLAPPLSSQELRYKVIAYCDYVKPATTCRNLSLSIKQWIYLKKVVVVKCTVTQRLVNVNSFLSAGGEELLAKKTCPAISSHFQTTWTCLG